MWFKGQFGEVVRYWLRPNLKEYVFLKKDKDKGLCAGEDFKCVFVCIFIMCQSRQIQSALKTATKQPEASLASSVRYVRFFLT